MMGRNAQLCTELSRDAGERLCGSQIAQSDRWYCWKSHPKAQYLAVNSLSEQGFRAWLPLHVAHREGSTETIRPIFGTYGFVAFDRSADRWRSIHSTRGVAHLFSADALHPIPVPRGIVEALQARGRPGDGVIDELYQGPEFPTEDLTGQRVRITSGPFANLHGLCRWSNQKRVAVLLEVMSKLVETTIARRDVEAEA